MDVHPQAEALARSGPAHGDMVQGVARRTGLAPHALADVARLRVLAARPHELRAVRVPGLRAEVHGEAAHLELPQADDGAEVTALEVADLIERPRRRGVEHRRHHGAVRRQAHAGRARLAGECQPRKSKRHQPARLAATGLAFAEHRVISRCVLLELLTTADRGISPRRPGRARSSFTTSPRREKRVAENERRKLVASIPMAGTILLDLVGGVALLLWGLHMVHSGIVRAFGSDLRRFLALALRNRVLAFCAGLLVTGLLQSSTATGLMTASFVTTGVLGLAPALAVMLGANVGTTLIVQVLSFNVAAFAPIFLIAGVVAFRRGARTRTRDIGRVSVGLGLMLLALHILLDTLAPAEQAPEVRALFAVLGAQPVLCIVVGALLAWAAHSSVAVILLVMSLAYAHFVTPLAALALVLGANLGSAVNPLFEGGSFDDPASRRLPVGNLINRAVGVALAYPFLGMLAEVLPRFEPNASRMVAEAHLAFNLVLALAFIGPLDAVAWLLTRALPERKA